MINSKEPVTGVIETDNKPYSFHLNNYSMIFLDAVVNSNVTSIMTPVDSFAQAYTHNGYKMLIYIGEKNVPVVNTMKMGIPSYIISTSNIFDYDLSYYDGIEFVGGTLSKLKRPCAIQTKYDENAKQTYIEKNDDSQKFMFETDEFVCEVEIGSNTSEKRSMIGTLIRNDRVYFRMMFNQKQTISSIYKHYNKICELLSFLTNRKSVGFEGMYLLQRDIVMGASKETRKVAEVYVEQQVTYSQKQPYHNLEFELLGDALGKLLTILYSPRERRKSYSLAFYPDNDESSTIVNNQTIRAVCSALECELGFIKDITNDEEKKIKVLRQKLQPIINEHRVSEDKLKEKTYSLIETSMSHWSMAASDQIKELYHRHEKAMKIIADKAYMIIEDADIDCFVKYRNDITHGSYRVLDHKIAFTTHILACLVYCCVLTRIGIPQERIYQWFNDGRLLR